MSKRFVVLSMMVASVLGGALSLGTYLMLFKPEPVVVQPGEAQPVVNQHTGSSRFTSMFEGIVENFTVPEGLNFVFAAERATPAVVHIINHYQSAGNYGSSELFEFFRDDAGSDSRRHATGSGVIISADGYVITNHHVIEGADRIEVVLNDKRSYTGTLIGEDPTTDMALVKIQAENLPHLSFGNSDDIKIGEWVLAVGNPFDLTSTVTAGIISAKARNISILRNQDGMAIESFIQTDAAVNPGNSGGALVNLRGELIGINTAIATRTGAYAGYSFAVPASLASKVSEDLLRYGQVQRALLGVSIREVNASLAHERNIKNIHGIFVIGVNKGSAADEAGIEVGDIITRIGDTEVNTVSALQELVARYRPGDKVSVSFERDGRLMRVKATLKNRNNTVAMISTIERIEQLGAEVTALNSSEKKKLNISGGVKVLKILPGVLQSEKIDEGFVITHVDKSKISSVDDLKSALRNKAKILLEGYDRNGEKAFFGIGF
jgi:Do/DeqQ family serine protease